MDEHEACTLGQEMRLGRLWIDAIMAADPELCAGDRLKLLLAGASDLDGLIVAEAIERLLVMNGIDRVKLREKGRRAFGSLDVSAGARVRWSKVCEGLSIDVDLVEVFIDLGLAWREISGQMRRSADVDYPRASTATILAT
ncbi:hypothetical protein JJB09_25500 [Rhizobium sp. KVB221]|uniref:Uncharacterized protein n=1 Tax=Rhizobium setariae TaxID=2801340 RepID=A0A936YWR3_9HYPH|nr:hypothetical protein [Rhizobium setariae]MBL0375372.1 hypothetical protein [Rhizobium setariae]